MRRISKTIMVAMCAFAALMVAGCERPRAGARVSSRPSLLGKPAPAFVTVDPDGNEIDLAKHLGKDVIMLDFWATWCGPCIMAMPEISQVATEYKDRGLVFYAMNVGEDQDTVREFLIANKFDFPVAMDFDGKIQDSFLADGLPHTILIGKDGRVQVDHLGYRPGVGKVLSAEVEELLAGKDLAGESVDE